MPFWYMQQSCRRCHRSRRTIFDPWDAENQTPGQLILFHILLLHMIQNRSGSRRTWSLYIAGIRFAIAMMSQSHPMDMWTFTIRRAYHWARHCLHTTCITKDSGSAVSDKNTTHHFRTYMSSWSLQNHNRDLDPNITQIYISTCGSTVNSSGWWWKTTRKECLWNALRLTNQRLLMPWKIQRELIIGRESQHIQIHLAHRKDQRRRHLSRNQE